MAQTLRDGWAVQKRVIHALLMREVLTRFGRHNIGFLWMFVEPIAFTLLVAGLWNLLGMGHGSNIPIVAFAMTGYSCVLLWRNVSGRLIHAVAPNVSLLYHRHVRLLDIYVARALLEVMGIFMSFWVLVGCFWLSGITGLPEDPLTVLLALFLMAWFGVALAICVGAASERGQLVEKFWQPISYVMFPLSGAAFLVDALPGGLQTYLLWIPMVSGTELLREGYFGSVFTARYDIPYLVAVNLGLTLFGLQQTAVVAERVTVE